MFALACGGDDKASEPVCPTLDNLESGIMDGTLDGAAWTTSGTTWAWTGDSLQLGTPATDGWLLSVVLQDSVNGETARAAVEGELPATFTLKSGADLQALELTRGRCFGADGAEIAGTTFAVRAN